MLSAILTLGYRALSYCLREKGNVIGRRSDCSILPCYTPM